MKFIFFVFFILDAFLKFLVNNMNIVYNYIKIIIIIW